MYTLDSQDTKFILASVKNRRNWHDHLLFFSISKVLVAACLLFDIFEEIGVTCVAVVVFGMKDGSYMHNITNVPVSPDPHVYCFSGV